MGPTANTAESGSSWCSNSIARSAGGDAIGGNIHQNHVGRKGLSSADDRVVGSQRHGGVAAHGAGHVGAIHQNLQHRALVIVRGEYGY